MVLAWLVLVLTPTRPATGDILLNWWKSHSHVLCTSTNAHAYIHAAAAHPKMPRPFLGMLHAHACCTLPKLPKVSFGLVQTVSFHSLLFVSLRFVLFKAFRLVWFKLFRFIRFYNLFVSFCSNRLLPLTAIPIASILKQWWPSLRTKQNHLNQAFV